MKYRRLLILLVLMIPLQPAMAADDSLIPGDLMNEIGYGAIIAMLALFIVAMLVLLRALRVLTKITLRAQGYTEEQIIAEMKPVKKVKKPKTEVWNKLLSLRPMSEEKELIIAHDYDGIQELNNPVPGWFSYLFYITIIFAIGYILIYHVFGVGQLQYDEYKTEMAQADIAKKEYLSKAANRVDETTVKLVTDQAVLASGQAVFKQSCVPCHGDHAQGVVGPNLTDDYWLHGGKINDVFKTIKYGVQAKGMPNWEKQLSPKQISDVANYIKSLHGSNPANPKEPQGEKDADDVAAKGKKIAKI
ncbi:c-type cytochrome [Mucilaginibacter rubeus]|uniref:C-type cytochrome n=2 Tax=Mucilaginibacter rubeus TaxID=2027860 RepID=A0AAE6MGF5_9SPHI|nr:MULTISPECIES: cbb3-type cytochrome c oxidase N-terminal domain-containing protein [Mucilaginibacter]QEM02466.1 c-type cytochrome [Mucilaginibacter rubeus]QEM15089.1 c-type cytochrome [Mucilaginibacter gossypii]QTE42189.1 c-type cytochrome [Mucilaginibacter rubeus]QTE48791.1 c-type cytochrome [Mucilaginibacter rubeus]QTE53889.1 c-type cytochrome [Mucilaginibacter rubeus]